MSAQAESGRGREKGVHKARGDLWRCLTALNVIILYRASRGLQGSSTYDLYTDNPQRYLQVWDLE